MQGLESFSDGADVTEGERGEEQRPPFLVRGDKSCKTPVIFASPHSGRHYPVELMRVAALDRRAIRKSEDALVDELVGSAVGFDIPLITATHARAYIDLNREPYELDQSMFADELPAYANMRTARVAAGLGSIARVVAEGQEIYNSKLLFADARSRIEKVHEPYHRALQDLISCARSRHGVALLVDWHSMPSAAADGVGGAGVDVVLGDRFGTSCAVAITDFFERHLSGCGYLVRRNAPYAGGYTTECYGRPTSGVNALQVELNRRLYLNEDTLQPNSGFDGLAGNLRDLIQTLAYLDWGRLQPT